ncbi:MAG: hypothetical protein LBT53_10085 [Puniceicoccales bacterium]|nr:hypothetical protein [Puniceicoccales bacterium]
MRQSFPNRPRAPHLPQTVRHLRYRLFEKQLRYRHRCCCAAAQILRKQLA